MGRGHIVGLESHHATVFQGLWSKGGAMVGSLLLRFPVRMAFRPTRHQGPGHCVRIFKGAEQIPSWRQQCVGFAWRVESREAGENELAPFPTVWFSAVCLQRESVSHSLPSERLQGRRNGTLRPATVIIKTERLLFYWPRSDVLITWLHLQVSFVSIWNLSNHLGFWLKK